MEVLGEAQDEGEDVVGDHVAEDPLHVGDDHRRFDQFGVEVLLHAGRGRLGPAQLGRLPQHSRRQVAEQGVGVADGQQGVGLVAGLHHGHRGGRGANLLQTCVSHWGEENEFEHVRPRGFQSGSRELL